MVISFCCCQTTSFPQAVLGIDSTGTLRQMALYQSTFEIYLFNCRSEKFIFFFKDGIVTDVLVATGWQLAAGRMLFSSSEILFHSVILLSVMCYTFMNSLGEDRFP